MVFGRYSQFGPTLVCNILKNHDNFAGPNNFRKFRRPHCIDLMFESKNRKIVEHNEHDNLAFYLAWLQTFISENSENLYKRIKF